MRSRSPPTTTAALGPSRGRRARARLVGLWVCAALSSCRVGRVEAPVAAPEGPATSGLRVLFMDVGNGDATLFLGPGVGTDRVAVLMDAGRLSADGGAVVSAVLRDQGVEHLDYVVASHYDADHIGGFVHVLGSTSVVWARPDCTPGPLAPRRAFIDLGPSARDTRSVAQWVRCVAQAGAQGVQRWAVVGGAHIGRSISLGGGYQLTIAAGDGYVLDRGTRVEHVNTSNERSIALWAHGGGFDLLVTGDLIGRAAGAENAAVEQALAEALAARGVDLEVLRVGHHGGANASARSSIQALRPEVAVVSVGALNSYGHPACSSLQNLQWGGVQQIVQTEGRPSACPLSPPPVIADGTIEVQTGPGDYTVRTVGPTSPLSGKPTTPWAVSCRTNRRCAPPTPQRPGAL